MYINEESQRRVWIFIGMTIAVILIVLIGGGTSGKLSHDESKLQTGTEETPKITESTSSDERLPEYQENVRTPAEIDVYNSADEPPIETSTEELASDAGTVTSLEAASLAKGGTYSFDLADHDFSALAILWSDGHLEYSFDNGPTAKLFPTDDMMDFEEMLSSELIETDADTLHITPLSAIDSLRIDLISPEPAEVPTEKTISATGVFNRDAGAQYSSLTIVSRDQWGANPSSWDPNSSTDIDDPARFTWLPYYHPVSRIVVHHTATTNNPSNPAAAVRTIYLYHTYTRGWGDIGYNYLIDHLGNIYEGKAGGDEVYGYHAYTEANAMSIGISMLGTFSTQAPTSAAQSSLVRLMAEKATLHDFDLKYSNGTLSKWLDTSYTVFGHRDSYFWCYSGHYYFTNPYVCNSQTGWAANPTACPGNTLRSLLASSITPRAQSYKDTHFSTLKDVVGQVENSVENDHFDDLILVGFKLPESASEAQVLALIPEFSGISEVNVEGNKANIYVYDWNNGGVTVPPDGWSGYNANGTFFPAASGSDDRLSTLLKIFRMDPQVSFAEFIGERDLFPEY